MTAPILPPTPLPGYNEIYGTQDVCYLQRPATFSLTVALWALINPVAGR